MQEEKNTEEYVIPENLEEDGKRSWKEKLTDFLSGRYFVPVVIILIAVISFSLGRVSGLGEKREPVKIINNSLPVSVNNAPLTPLLQQEGGTGKTNSGEVKGAATVQTSVGPLNPGGYVVASKNSTKYHYPWCAGAKQISPQNLITFPSIESARAAGLTPATNCKGLK